MNCLKGLCFTLLALLAFNSNSQELTIKEKYTNPSTEINDGKISVQVVGGTPPYTYKWSNQSTPLNSDSSSGLTEGIPYTVLVTDAKGLTAEN